MVRDIDNIIYIDVLHSAILSKVKRHISIIAKRAKSSDGSSLFSDLTTSSVEDEKMWRDYIESAAQQVCSTLDYLSGGYKWETTGDKIMFIVSGERWWDKNEGEEYGDSNANRKKLKAALKSAIENYLWQYPVCAYLSAIHPSYSEKYSPVYASTYEKQCVASLALIHNLAFLKRESTTSTLSYADMQSQGGEPAETYTLTLIVDSQSAGRGTLYGAGEYEDGTYVNISAYANRGYAFTGWYDDSGTLVSTSNPYCFNTTNEDVTYMATFGTSSCVITAQSSVLECYVDGGGTYAIGEKVTLVAYNGPGWYFNKWTDSDGNEYADTSISFYASNNKTFTASFSEEKYSLTVNVTPSDKSGGYVMYNEGPHGVLTDVLIGAYVNNGYKFVGFFRDGAQLASELIDDVYMLTLTMQRDTELQAIFSLINSYSITAYSNDTSKGAVYVSEATVDEGGGSSVTATPATGYMLDKITDNYGNIYRSTTVNITGINKDYIFTAHFKESSTLYAVTVTTDPSAGGYVTGAGNYTLNTNVRLLAVARNGYYFDGWYNGTTRISALSSYEFVVDGNKTLTAKFAAYSTAYIYTDIEPAAGGTVSGAGEYPVGNSVVLNAYPNTGYKFEKWTQGGSDVGTSPTLYVTANGDKTYKAVFSVIDSSMVSVALSADPSDGAVQLVGAGAYYKGDNVNITAIARNGFEFVGWSEGSSTLSDNPSYTLQNISKDHLITAGFEWLSNKWVGITATNSIENAGTITIVGEEEHTDTSATRNPVKKYLIGSKVTLTASPIGSNIFEGWYSSLGQKITADKVYTMIVPNAPISLVAKYAATEFAVNLSTNSSSFGTVTHYATDDITKTPKAKYPNGTNITVKAVPNTGYSFINWTYPSGDIRSTSAIYAVGAVSEDLTLKANFGSQTVTITCITPGGGGTVSGTGTKTKGSQFTLTATPNEGYWFYGWENDMTSYDVVSGNTVTSYAYEDRNFVATFISTSKKYINFASSPTSGGTIRNATTGAVMANGIMDADTRLYLSASAANGYVFERWTRDGVSFSTDVITSYTVPFGDATTINIIAIFKESSEPTTERYIKMSAASGQTQKVRINYIGANAPYLEDIEYKLGSGTSWTDWTDVEDYIEFGGNHGDLYLRGKERSGIGADYGSFNYFKFYDTSVQVAVTGDLTALINYEETVTTLPAYCFSHLFKNCTNVTTVPDIPNVATVGEGAYCGMFEGCTGLTSITCRSTTDILDKCFEWLKNAASSGTLYVPDPSVWDANNTNIKAEATEESAAINWTLSQIN